MSTSQAEHWTRRAFLGGLSLAGTAGLLSLYSRPVAAEPPPETTRLRVIHDPSICVASQFVAEELLRAEGFTEVRYVKVGPDQVGIKLVATGDADLIMQFAGKVIVQVDAGDPVIALTGVHVGCFELFGSDRVRSCFFEQAIFGCSSKPGLMSASLRGLCVNEIEEQMPHRGAPDFPIRVP
jgi:NitT/TauT family transport system substrate-binding protein